MKAQLYLLLCIASFGIVACDVDEDRTEIIDIRPTGQLTTEKKDLEGFTCSFTYQAEGGTDEQWMMQLFTDSTRTNFECSVGRESGQSYLFFESFKMTVTGGKVVQGTVLGPHGKQLGPEEYKLDQSENTVSSVPKKFQSQLVHVELAAVKRKEEL